MAQTMTREQAIETARSRIDCKNFLRKAKGGSYICPFCRSGEGVHHTGASLP